MACRRPNQTQIWASLLYLFTTYGELLIVFKVILRSFRVFPIIDNFVFQKRLVVEHNGVKFGTLEH